VLIALDIWLSNHVRFSSLFSGLKSSSTAEYVVWDILFNRMCASKPVNWVYMGSLCYQTAVFEICC